MEKQFSVLQSAKATAERCLVIGFLCIVCALINPFPLSDEVLLLFKFVLFILGLVLLVIGMIRYTRVHKTFYDDVVPKMVSGWFENGQCHLDGDLLESVVNESHLFDDADSYHSDNVLQGHHKGVSFFTGRLRCYRLVEQRSRHGIQHYEVITFTGRLLAITFNKSFQGALYCLDRKQRFTAENLHAIQLESVTFNQTFDVYATDEHLAFYLLTPTLMHRIELFFVRYPETVGLSLIDGVLYIALANYKRLFELKLFARLNLATQAKFYQEVQYIIDAIENLNESATLFKADALSVEVT